ncbi:MAG: hypothetical protein K6B74_13310 [Ruminococcus sp.]|nr:hypothetical protein [Ruminococcus sp.]
MKDFIGYALKNHAGLIRFIKMMCGVLCGTGVFYLITLIALKIDGTIGWIDLPLMELSGIVLSGVCFATAADSLIRMGVSCGVSRKTILKGLAAAAPVYAAVSAALTELAEEVTVIIFRLFGIRLRGLGYVTVDDLLWNATENWRTKVFGFCAVLMFTFGAFAAAFMYIAGKTHSRKRGVTAAVLTVFVYWIFSVNIDCKGWLYDLLNRAAEATEPWKYIGRFDPPPSLIFSQTELLTLTLIGFYLLYGLFAVIMRNAPIRGRETG